MDAVIAVDGLTKRFGDVTAVNDISLRIGTGEIFVLIGPNGAGKTTLVRSLTGTLSPTGGRVRLFDHEPLEVARDRIGLLPQGFHPAHRLTGREILAYYAGLYDRAQPVDEVLEAVGMDASADRWYERLSGGQRRRICVGVALVNDPDLLVLDEPTTGIDPSGRRKLWELLTSLRDAGRTVLLTTHDMAEAAALADRVGLLADGRLIETGAPVELVERHAGTGRIVVSPSGPVDDPTLASLPGPVTKREGDVIVEEISRDEIAAALRAIDETNLAYSRISWEQPTLEDVFFALTSDGAPAT